MNNNLKPSEKICSPFMYYCQKVIPLAFDESMSYYETLCHLVHYLKNTVMPAVNNNADALTEVQGAFNQLEKYVDDYFKNLDVQTEINNKLDEMAESGELTDIIAQYLQLAGVLSYDTKDILKNASNVVNGSTCRTLGSNNYLDGKGNFYKIRNIRTSDVIDDENIIALNNSDTLIAEKIPNFYINELNTRIDNIINKRYIFIGDSYANGVTNSTETTTSWVDYVVGYLNITNYNKIAENGCGFYNTGENGHNFQTLLASYDEEIQNKDTITDIVLCSGINDNNVTYDNIELGINAFITYAREHYPNAKISFGMISNTKDTSSWGLTTRENLCNNILRNYQYANVNYLNGVEKILKYYYFISNDNIHPNQSGYRFLGIGIAQALRNGSVNLNFNDNELITFTNSNLTTNNFYMYARIFGDMLYLSSPGSNLEFTNVVAEQNDVITLGTVNYGNYFRRTEVQTFAIHTYAIVELLGGEIYGCPVMLNINDNNELYMKPYLYSLTGSGKMGFTGVKKITIEAFNLAIPVLLS